MTLTAPAPAPPPARDDRRPPTHRAHVHGRHAGATAVVTLGAAGVVLVAVDGSPGWRLARTVTVVVTTGAGVLVARRGGRFVRAAGATVTGVVGVTAGAGIGVMHLAKGDVGVTAIAGTTALAAGLWLLAASAVLAWRAVPRWWRLVAVPVAFALVELVLIPVTVGVYAANPPPVALGDATPAELGLAYRDVTFATTDGVALSGWYVPSRNGAAVVLAHGAGSTRTAVLAHAAVLARHGYGVLLFDARGHGRSGGHAMDLGWWGDRDFDAAVTWLAGRPDVDAGRLGAVGLSMGGEEAIGAAASDPRLLAVVAEGALGRGSMDTDWVSGGVTGAIERAMLTVQTAVAAVLTSAPTPIGLRDAVRAIAPRPVLLIAGRPEIPGDRAYRDASPGNVELWELPDTPHTAGLARHPDEWSARVTSFLDAALLGAR